MPVTRMQRSAPKNSVDIEQSFDVPTQSSEIAHFDTIFRNAGAGIVVAALSGQIIRANKAYEKITGYTEQELIKIGWRQLPTRTILNHT